MLFESLNTPKPLRKRILTLVISIILHGIGIIAVVIIPLIFHDSLPQFALLTFLSPPMYFAPPPPPPPSPRVVTRPRDINTTYSVPKELPRTIPPPDTAPPPINAPISNMDSIGSAAGSVVGVPGGIPGGLAENPLPPPPPPPTVKLPPEPPPKAVSKPIYVGGDIQEAKLIYKQPVVYPDLALKARITGIVLLRITVDEEGKVADVKVISGHPVLVPAAVEAVSHWKYSPTMLNGQAVRVIATVAVNFALR